MLKDKFFPVIPEVKESFRKFAEQITGWQVKDSNIKKIKVQHFSNRIKRHISSDICVGEELDTNFSNIPHEPVLAIFESKEYLVITPNKNNSKGTVYFFEPKEILNIEKEANVAIKNI